jgi:hypothetical protein
MTREQAQEKAKEQSLKDNCYRYVIKLEDYMEETYVYSVCSADYLDTDEFEAFDMKIVAEYFGGKETI